MTATAWARLRSPAFHAEAHRIIAGTMPVRAVTHLRSAHYAVYRVEAADGSSHVVRFGIAGDRDDAPASNTGYLGTSAKQPAGQHREFLLARGFAAAGADVVVPDAYELRDGLDVLWMPWLASEPAPVTAEQWHRTLSSLQAYRPAEELPVFTNRAKSFARLDELGNEALAAGLRNRYDTAMEVLFEESTAWSAVHGDAHAGNVLTIRGSAVLYDFDTVCWAPSVWDLTHLLNRAGTGANTGYTSLELLRMFHFTPAEVRAALHLRKVAALIAKVHREHATPAAEPRPVAAAA